MEAKEMVERYKLGATIDGITKDLMRSENEKLTRNASKKTKVVKLTYKECRWKVEEVILREVWNKFDKEAK